MNPEINPFYSAKCTPEALELMNQIREAFKGLGDILEEMGKDSKPESDPKIGKRELALAKTNLEQASMWAIKSISHYNVDKTNQ